MGTGSPPGQVPLPQQAQLQDNTTAASENAPAMPPPDPVSQSLGSLQSGGLQTLNSNSMPSSYPNAPQPIGPPSGSVSHSHFNTQSASQDQPMHKPSTSDLGGVAVDPPVRPSYNPQPQQDLHSNGGPQHAQHDAWGTVSNKPSIAGSLPGQPGAASQAGLSQQGNFSQTSQHQHQGPQQNLGPSLLSSLNGQTSSGPSTSDALHSLASLSTPALSTSAPADNSSHTNFQQDRTSQYTMLPQVDQLQMQFGQVQLNSNEFNSGFGTGFGPSSSQSQSQDTSSNPLEPDMSFLHQQPSQLQQHSQQQQQQQPQQLPQQAGRSGSDAAASTADGLIQQHRPSGSSDYQSSGASRGYGAFPQSHVQPASSRAIPAASQSGPASVSAGIQTEPSSLGDNAGEKCQLGAHVRPPGALCHHLHMAVPHADIRHHLLYKHILVGGALCPLGAYIALHSFASRTPSCTHLASLLAKEHAHCCCIPCACYQLSLPLLLASKLLQHTQGYCGHRRGSVGCCRNHSHQPLLIACDPIICRSGLWKLWVSTRHGWLCKPAEPAQPDSTVPVIWGQFSRHAHCWRSL